MGEDTSKAAPLPTDEELDAMFEPTIEEAILASGGHTEGRVNTPEGGDTIDVADVKD
jgi:hypothetical protein